MQSITFKWNTKICHFNHKVISWVTIETDFSKSIIFIQLFSSIILLCSYIGAFTGEIVIESFCWIDHKEDGTTLFES